MLANKGFALCASVRLQAKLNLLDPAVFRLPVQLSAPPLKAVCSTVCEHQAAGTCPTPQSVLLASVHSAASVKPRSEAPANKFPDKADKTEDAGYIANGVTVCQQQESSSSAAKVSFTGTYCISGACACSGDRAGVPCVRIHVCKKPRMDNRCGHCRNLREHSTGLGLQ